MIGIAVILSAIASIAALLNRGRLWKLALVFIVLSVMTFFLTNHFVNSCTASDYCGIGYGIIGSLISLAFALAAVVCSFQPKQSK